LIDLAPEAAKSIKVVYSFWPVSYSNTIRTREVQFGDGKKATVDFRKEDAQSPDLIKPIYFPTPPEVVDLMCEMGEIGKDDVVFDIGCGDGRMVVAGVKKFGAKKGVGIDIDPDLVKECRRKAGEAGVSDKVEFRNEDALKIKDLSEATVVLLYVGDDFGAKLEPVLRKTLKPGARVVSHRFKLGGWEPDIEKKITAKNNYDKDEDYVLKLWRIK
jgi:SAM-dependent methyltransferase